MKISVDDIMNVERICLNDKNTIGIKGLLRGVDSTAEMARKTLGVDANTQRERCCWWSLSYYSGGKMLLEVVAVV